MCGCPSAIGAWPSYAVARFPELHRLSAVTPVAGRELPRYRYTPAVRRIKTLASLVLEGHERAQQPSLGANR
jgi:hypothetical protein